MTSVAQFPVSSFRVMTAGCICSQSYPKGIKWSKTWAFCIHKTHL